MAVKFEVSDMDGRPVGTMELPDEAFVIVASPWGDIETVTLKDEYAPEFAAEFARVNGVVAKNSEWVELPVQVSEGPWTFNDTAHSGGECSEPAMVQITAEAGSGSVWA